METPISAKTIKAFQLRIVKPILNVNVLFTCCLVGS